MEILNLTWLFLWTISFLRKLLLKTIVFSDDANSVPNNYGQLSLRTFHVCSNWIERMINAYMYIMYLLSLGPIDLPVNCRATIVYTHNRFLTRNIIIIFPHCAMGRIRPLNIFHTKCFSDSREKWLERNEKRPKRDETRLARNETRGGNLPLSSTVLFHLKQWRK